MRLAFHIYDYRGNFQRTILAADLYAAGAEARKRYGRRAIATMATRETF